MCGDSSEVMITSLASEREVSFIAMATGATLASTTLPWTSSSEIPLLARQTQLQREQETGHCLQAMSFGPFFAIWSGRQVVARGEWVERVPVAPVEVGAGGAQRFARGARITTTGIASVASHFVVLFRSTSHRRDRVLDVYDARTGAYRLSIDLPERADYLAIAGDRVIVGGESEDGGIFVAAYAGAPGLRALLADARGDREETSSRPRVPSAQRPPDARARAQDRHRIVVGNGARANAIGAVGAVLSTSGRTSPRKLQ